MSSCPDDPEELMEQSVRLGIYQARGIALAACSGVLRGLQHKQWVSYCCPRGAGQLSGCGVAEP